MKKLKSFIYKITPITWIFIALIIVPIADLILPPQLHFTELLRPIIIFSILGLGLNMLTGYTGVLNLGVAAFMAIGAYGFGILTCDIYPFQFGFCTALIATTFVGFCSGLLLGLPTMRLRGDYLALVTLGFGEIVQDSLKNLESITQGIQGINPLPPPIILGYQFPPDFGAPWYYLFLLILALAVFICKNLERSNFGRALAAIKQDELAATCSGVNPVNLKLMAFALAASLCSAAGALWACHLGSTGDPGNYDFQLSVLALCIVVVGGAGSIPGIILGSLLMIGFNSIILVKLAEYLSSSGTIDSNSVFLAPHNWKYLIFGLALIFTMRFRPNGLWPVESRKRT